MRFARPFSPLFPNSMYLCTINFLKARFRPDEPICLTLIGHPGARSNVVAAIYDDHDQVLRDIDALDGTCHIYVNLNRVMRTRITNRIDFSRGWRFDGRYVERRTGLLFDIDSNRDTPMATPDQLVAANALADKLREHLLPTLGEPQTDVMTGNGRQIVYEIDLPKSSDLPERILRKQAKKFEGDGAHIDTGVHDVARIIRVPGTENVKSQPGRRAHLVSAALAAHPIGAC